MLKTYFHNCKRYVSIICKFFYILTHTHTHTHMYVTILLQILNLELFMCVLHNDTIKNGIEYMCVSVTVFTL
jgi:hypothetical protein